MHGPDTSGRGWAGNFVEVDMVESPRGARTAVGGPDSSGAGVGFMLGLFGYLVALVAFGYEGLFSGGADARDQLSVGLTVAHLVTMITSVSVLVAVLRLRRQRRAAAGLLGGAGVGVMLIVLLSLRVAGIMGDVAGTCPCEPIVDQVRFSHQSP